MKKFLKGGAELMDLNLMEKVGLIAVDKVLEDETAQNFFKGLGADIAQGIPGNVAEPKINKIVDLIQEGMTEENLKNN